MRQLKERRDRRLEIGHAAAPDQCAAPGIIRGPEAGETWSDRDVHGLLTDDRVEDRLIDLRLCALAQRVGE